MKQFIVTKQYGEASKLNTLYHAKEIAPGVYNLEAQICGNVSTEDALVLCKALQARETAENG